MSLAGLIVVGSKLPIIGSVLLSKTSQWINSMSTILNFVSESITLFFYWNQTDFKDDTLGDTLSQPISLLLPISSISIILIKTYRNELNVIETILFLVSVGMVSLLNLLKYIVKQDLQKEDLNLIISPLFLTFALSLRIFAKILQINSNHKATKSLIVNEICGFIRDTLCFQVITSQYDFPLLAFLSVVSLTQILLDAISTRTEKTIKKLKKRRKIRQKEDEDKTFIDHDSSLIDVSSMKDLEWIEVLNNDELTISMHNDKVIRLQGSFNTNSTTFLSLFTDQELKKRWNPLEFTVLREPEVGTKIITLKVPLVFPMSARQFFYYEKCVFNSDHKILISKSFPKDHKIYEKKDRGATIALISQYVEAIDVKDSIEVNLYLDLDLGNLPKFMITKFIQNALPFLYDKLRETVQEIENESASESVSDKS